MKKVLSLLLTLVMLSACAVTAGAVWAGGSYKPITPDEIQKGEVLAYDSVEGDFNTTVYYVKILCEDGEERIYPLADWVYLGDIVNDAEGIADRVFGEITFVVRGGNIKFINPVMPDGLFDNVEIKYCHKENDTIYAIAEFENIVGEFKLIMAAYSGDMLCSIKSFDISYLDSYYELDMPAKGGDKVKIFYWEDVAGLVPVWEAVADYMPTEYGYLISVNETDGEYAFEMLTDEGEIVTFDCAEKIVLDDEIEPLSNITTRLKSSAKSANATYEDEKNAKYSQIVMYALNENGEVAHIDTVVSFVNKKISTVADEGLYYSPYGYKQFVYKDKSFGDFTVGEDTIVFFAPDDRSAKDEYLAYKYSKNAFFNTKSYHVEAYGLSTDKVASAVVMYKDNGKNIYRYDSPAMIVESKISSADGVYVRGYALTSYSLKRVKVNMDSVKSLNAMGKGDVIRYLTNSSSEMVDYNVWYDADNPVQEESCAGVDEAISKRILEIKATSIDPVVNYPDATFRLQYGTVSSITLSKEGDTICVTPTIADDNCEMAYEGNGVIEWEIENIVKVFEYDKEEVLAVADLEDIVPGKTEVIAYSSQGQLRMLYIVKKPYISEKKIMTVQKGTETVDGYKITGYSEGKEVVFMVDATKEPVIKEVYTGRIIAYVPDGKTIKDIEIVFEGTHEGFKPEDGESLIAKDTKETLVFGLSEYTTDGAVINGVKYTVTEDTNYLLVKYAGNIVNYGLGKHMEMKNEYVLIRVKANKPTEIADVVIFQGLN